MAALKPQPLTFLLGGFAAGVTDWAASLTAAELGLGSELGKVRPPIAVRLSISRVGDELQIRGACDLEVEQACTRCLRPVATAVSAPIEVIVRQHPSRESSSGDIPEGILYHDGERFSLCNEVRELILLAVPSNPLCSADCHGLCPRCGADLREGKCACPRGEEIDPRWQALRALKGAQRPGPAADAQEPGNGS